MIRILFLLTLAATPLYAQGALTLNGSVPSNRIVTRLYEVDLGATSTSYTVSVMLTTNSGSGLSGTLIDMRALAGDSAQPSNAEDIDTTTGAGTVNMSVSGTGSGRRWFAIELTTVGTAAADYDGTISSTVGTLTFLRENAPVRGATGLQVFVDAYARYARVVGPSSTVAASVELDYGPASQTLPLRIEAVGSGLTRVDLFDVSGGSAQLLAQLDPVGGTLDDVAVVVLTRDGKVNLRVNAVGSAVGGNVVWRIMPAGTVPLSTTSNDDEPGEDDGDCAAHGGAALPWALLALVGFAYRRRPACLGA